MLHYSGMEMAYPHQEHCYFLQSSLVGLWSSIAVHGSADAKVVCSSVVADIVATVAYLDQTPTD